MKLAMSFSARSILLLLAAATLFFASCSPEALDDLNGVGSMRISRDTVWTKNKPILLEGAVNIEGATLTIEAGTTIRMGRNGAFVIGENQAGALKINGTADAPVRIIPSSQEIYWRGIHFIKTRSESRIAHCELEQASSTNESALELTEVNFPIENLRLVKCGGDGIEIHKAAPNSPQITNLYVETPTGNPLTGDASLLYALGHNITLTAPNGGVYLASGTLTADRFHFRNLSRPYIVRTEISINAKRLGFDAQTRFEFERNGGLNIGGYSETKVQAEGVVFTGRGADLRQGMWRGVIVNSHVVGRESYFRKCLFDAGGGGNEKGNLVLYDVDGLEVSDSQFSRSAGYGIVLIASSIRELSPNRFTENGQGDKKSEKR